MPSAWVWFKWRRPQWFLPPVDKRPNKQLSQLYPTYKLIALTALLLQHLLAPGSWGRSLSTESYVRQLCQSLLCWQARDCSAAMRRSKAIKQSHAILLASSFFTEGWVARVASITANTAMHSCTIPRGSSQPAFPLSCLGLGTLSGVSYSCPSVVILSWRHTSKYRKKENPKFPSSLTFSCFFLILLIPTEDNEERNHWSPCFP